MLLCLCWLPRKVCFLYQLDSNWSCFAGSLLEVIAWEQLGVKLVWIIDQPHFLPAPDTLFPHLCVLSVLSHRETFSCYKCTFIEKGVFFTNVMEHKVLFINKISCSMTFKKESVFQLCVPHFCTNQFRRLLTNNFVIRGGPVGHIESKPNINPVHTKNSTM